MKMSLFHHVRDEILRLRAQESRSGNFMADQLERVAQIIVFTGAETPEQYADRVFANEQAVQEQHFERGYQEGRESVLRYRNPCTN
jgi:hypothetical protein